MPYKIHHSLVGLCKCWVKILRKKLMKNENTICWLKTVYDDNIIKWPLKHRKSIEKLWQKLSLEWYSRRTVLIGWVENSLDAFVAPCYSRNRAFRGIWWLIQRFFVISKCPPWKTAALNAPEAGITELFVKEDSAVATVCEVLAVCAVLVGLNYRSKSTKYFNVPRFFTILVWRSHYSKYSVPSAVLRSFTSDQHIWQCLFQPLNPKWIEFIRQIVLIKASALEIPSMLFS